MAKVPYRRESRRFRAGRMRSPEKEKGGAGGRPPFGQQVQTQPHRSATVRRWIRWRVHVADAKSLTTWGRYRFECEAIASAARLRRFGFDALVEGEQ